MDGSKLQDLSVHSDLEELREIMDRQSESDDLLTEKIKYLTSRIGIEDSTTTTTPMEDEERFRKEYSSDDQWRKPEPRKAQEEHCPFIQTISAKV